MTVPILRDIELTLPLNDAEVARGEVPLLTVWTGRAGEAAEMSVVVTELLPGGALGSVGGGAMVADPDHPGRYSRSLTSTAPGGYYRLTVTAADPGVSADTTSQTFRFSTTPGSTP